MHPFPVLLVHSLFRDLGRDLPSRGPSPRSSGGSHNCGAYLQRRSLMPTIAGEPVTLAEVRGTLRMLRYYRAFLRSDPHKYGECAKITAHVRSLRDALFWGGTMDRDETR